jgi:hypothetical protein
MTLPFERLRAVNSTREFLFDLLIPSKTQRVPKEVRDRARSLLRHYPFESDMEMVSDMNKLGEHCQPIFSKDMWK